jgi:hypothetical protein
MFSNHFDVLMLKIIFFKTNIILMCFEMKNILKNSRYHLSNTEPLGFLLF